MLTPISKIAEGSSESLSSWQHKAQQGKIFGIIQIGHRYYSYTDSDDLNYVSVSEYAASVGKSTAAIRRMIGRNGIPGAIYCGSQWLIPQDAEYLDRRGKWDRSAKSRPKCRPPKISNLNALFRSVR